MSAPANIPPEYGPEVEVRWDREQGFVIVEADTVAAEMEARLRAGAAFAQALFHLLLIAAAIFGTACLLSQTAKWAGM